MIWINFIPVMSRIADGCCRKAGISRSFIVNKNMQPATISLWLANPKKGI